MNRPALSYPFARQHGVLAVADDAGVVTLAHKASASLDALMEARRVVGVPVRREVLSPEAFEQRLSGVYAQADLAGASEDAMGAPQDLTALADGLPRTSDLLDSSDDAPIIRLINGILQEAIRSRASDIHIEPYEQRLSVRFRIDGTLSEALSLPARLAPALTSRVKVMSRLDIAQKRVPQDGRFSLNLGERAVDLRVSTLPSRHGERVVMRLLEKDSQRLALEDLGMDPDVLGDFNAALARPNGIILVTGPTGSGKTTSLYAALSRLNDGTRNILTVEDPVEYALDGIGQTQVNNAVGMSFAAGLRAILRQDPDVVMVGEIRDPETAEIAVQASLTGHLVLSTVHTNSAVASVARLRDMGVEPFLLSSTLSALVAQRLVRRLCDSCKEAYTPSPTERAELGLNTPRGAASAPRALTFFKPVGCPECAGVGYRGRLGIYEIVPVDEGLRSLIHEGASDLALSRHAFQARQSLLADGAEKVVAGLTSSDEVLRVCHAEVE